MSCPQDYGCVFEIGEFLAPGNGAFRGWVIRRWGLQMSILFHKTQLILHISKNLMKGDFLFCLFMIVQWCEIVHVYPDVCGAHLASQ